jgi:hypothetical protein
MMDDNFKDSDFKDGDFIDSDLEKLLARVKQPALPIGFAERLQAKLQVEAPNNVIAFPQKKSAVTASSRRVWLSAIPLAASLALGVYFGAMGTVPETFSGLEGTFISDASETLPDIGFEDTESFLNGDLS